MGTGFEFAVDLGSNMVGPNALLAPHLGELGLIDYHRAAECIEEGRASVTRMLPAIRDALASS